MSKRNSSKHVSLEVINGQLGAGCNPNDALIIDRFKGSLAFIYAQATPEIQQAGENRAPMTADYGGQMPVLNIRNSEFIGVNKAIEFMPGMTLELPELIGAELRLTYNTIENCAITLLHGELDHE